KLFLELGYSSLFKFVVKELKYSEGAAFRRVAALQLTKDLPEVESKIESGDLSLSTAAQVQNFIVNEKKMKQPLSPSAQKELVDLAIGKSKTEVTKILIERSPNNASVNPVEKFRQVSASEAVLNLVIDKELGELLERARELQQLGEQSMQETIKRAMKFYLEK